MPGELVELQEWYEAQCDGDWEHEFGVHIGTLDNPGWMVDIDLEGTPLEGRAFPRISDMAPEREWMLCEVADGKFRGRGGPAMLDRILRAFLAWVRETQSQLDEPTA